MSRASEAALKAYPLKDYTKEPNYIHTCDTKMLDEVYRDVFRIGYEQAQKDIIEHCEKRIAEYNAQNLSNMFLRRAFEDVIRFIKEIPYNDYKDEDDE